MGLSPYMNICVCVCVLMWSDDINAVLEREKSPAPSLMLILANLPARRQEAGRLAALHFQRCHLGPHHLFLAFDCRIRRLSGTRSEFTFSFSPPPNNGGAVCCSRLSLLESDGKEQSVFPVEGSYSGGPASCIWRTVIKPITAVDGQ